MVSTSEADRKMLEELEAELARGSTVPVPGEARFVNFPREPMPIRPAPFNLYFVSIPGRGLTYIFPVIEAISGPLKKGVGAVFAPPDTRQTPIRSDAYDVEFGLERIQLRHSGGPGSAQCELRLRCQILLPNRYKVIQFILNTNSTFAIDNSSLANPISAAAAQIARQFAARIRNEDFLRQLASYRTEEWVCSATGHKKDPQIEGQFCPNHAGKPYVKRIALKSGP